MLTKALAGAGLRESQFQAVSLFHVVLCILLWIRAGTLDQDERGNAERRALFVGLWPPMFWLMGQSVGRHTRARRRPRGGWGRR